MRNIKTEGLLPIVTKTIVSKVFDTSDGNELHQAYLDPFEPGHFSQSEDLIKGEESSSRLSCRPSIMRG